MPNNTKDLVAKRKFLFKRVPEVQYHRQITVTEKNDTWGVDLADYTGNEKENNRGYILVAIDFFTRYAMTAVIRNKTKSCVEHALESFFTSYGKPKKINSDKESALIHSKLLKSHQVELYHSQSSDKNTDGSSVLAERVIQSLKTQLEQYRSVTIGRQWKAHVDEVTDNYNHTIHSSIRMKPNDAFWDDNVQESLLEHHLQRKLTHDKEDPDKFKDVQPDDVVVAAKEKQKFEKGYTQRFKAEALTVVEIRDTHPKQFVLSDGTITYGEHIQKINEEQQEVLKNGKGQKKQTETPINEIDIDQEVVPRTSIGSRLRNRKQEKRDDAISRVRPSLIS